MSERHERCRHWPNCMIHLGQPRELGGAGGGRGAFSPANRAEMRELHDDDAWTHEEVAAAFGSTPRVVAQIVRAERARLGLAGSVRVTRPRHTVDERLAGLPEPPGCLAERIAAVLVEAIDTGALAAGSPLPPALHIARRYRTGADTGRHVVRLLADRGLVEHHPRRGAIVVGRPW